MFESISLVLYNVIEPKPYVAPTSNLTHPLGLEQGAVEYLASCLSRSKQRATQLSIEGGRADHEILTKPQQEPGGSNGYNYPFYDCVQHDFGDAWVAKRGFGSSDEVTLTVPRWFRLSQCHVGSNREVKYVCQKKAHWALGTILDSKWEEAVSDILSASTKSDPSPTRE
ncbi:hypothetical protein O181_052310 [Austropuccinia psidii MF-1]|uniref:Uncharacterized protein n=1 Tax=Austropuccinia psidii MF-1 TaxID=1389203 RepID=A0A9Q3DYM6_9BASI|nr:hypothetical protein [Austropuccinia psidii MF-1]